MSKSIAVMVLIETDDPRFDIDSHLTVKTAAQLRQAVIDNLPKLTRVILACDEEEARLMIHAHRVAMDELGIEYNLPPAHYVPPTRE